MYRKHLASTIGRSSGWYCQRVKNIVASSELWLYLGPNCIKVTCIEEASGDKVRTFLRLMTLFLDAPLVLSQLNLVIVNSDQSSSGLTTTASARLVGVPTSTRPGRKLETTPRK